MTFKVGDVVLLKPNSDLKKEPPHIETATVTEPYVVTDAKRIDGTPVGHYVRTTRGLYHEESLTTEFAK